MSLGTIDLLRNAGIDPNDVVLIRHTVARVGRFARLGYLRERTGMQSESFIGRDKSYWMTFMGEPGGTTRFAALYKLTGRQPLETGLPAGYPSQEFNPGDEMYSLVPCDLLAEYENRLTIDWGGSYVKWAQYGTNDKRIVSIEERKPQFPGFDKLLLSFDDLSDIIGNPELYSAYRDAMSQVSAVYLVVDTVSGQQYVGSAYGENGLWGRWTEYASTNGEGGNKLMHDLMSEHPDRYHALQYTVLRILDKTTPMTDVIALEGVYKQKLGSRAFGLNAN
ncbi:GIY-YIG nuclease family protein [Bifidobacterium sp. MA2]|uniref:GIY-YIG nuclease family protein n=1 Tax=Bifidobacterium santillanense TaxID=2809028 RepID=A0ABS5ULT2_9BIFI|nr:GIY-YIG nuclease family protein [Bifidobacterium santillanense]MBT1171862.1 GIY-YIG nuclease family protein [Bifidobacterium santillanense]